jgi:hypothetical protein
MKAAIAGVGRRDDTIVASPEWSLCRLVRRDIKCHLGGSAGGPLSNVGLFDLYPKLLILLVRKRDSNPRLRIPTKPAMHSNLKPATYTDLKPATVPI